MEETHNNMMEELTTPSDGMEQAGCTQAPTARTSTFLFPITSVLITGFVIFRSPTTFVLAAILKQQHSELLGHLQFLKMMIRIKPDKYKTQNLNSR